jgi:hypothetical protein
VKYLAIQQNKLLSEAELMMQKDDQFSQKRELTQIGLSTHKNSATEAKRSAVSNSKQNMFPKVHLFELKSDLIIHFRENPSEPKT